LREIVEENGGTAIRSRVGHSYIKKLMAESGAIFGGEHSGHFYFGDFWRTGSGMLAALFALSELTATDLPLSQLLAPYNRYVASGEINTKVANTAASLELVKSAFQADSGIDDLDGYTVTGPDWWFNVRGSNTEPLLRLNVEASSRAEMERVRRSGPRTYLGPN
jgi:phosphomannomutase